MTSTLQRLARSLIAAMLVTLTIGASLAVTASPASAGCNYLGFCDSSIPGPPPAPIVMQQNFVPLAPVAQPVPAPAPAPTRTPSCYVVFCEPYSSVAQYGLAVGGLVTCAGVLTCSGALGGLAYADRNVYQNYGISPGSVTVPHAPKITTGPMRGYTRFLNLFF